MLKKLLVLTMLLAISLAAGSTALAAPADGWLTTDDGAKVWMMGIEAGDTGKWSGGRDAEGYADGLGTIQRFEKGTLTSSVDCTMKKGKIEGFAKQSYSGGSTYEGDFVGSNRTGKGIMKWPDGRVYDGEWTNNIFNGKGLMKIPDGRSYEGDFVNGVYNGKGIMKFPNGTVHEGDWVNGAPNGKGVLKMPNGSIYEGDFLQGQRTGKGTFRFPDGSRYVGDFLNGSLHGNGILYNPAGQILMQGKWANDKFVPNAK